MKATKRPVIVSTVKAFAQFVGKLNTVNQSNLSKRKSMKNRFMLK